MFWPGGECPLQPCSTTESREDAKCKKSLANQSFSNYRNTLKNSNSFVCAVSKSTTGVSHLRSYASPTQLVTTPPTILEAALATSAATGVFDPVKIGAREYVDGALGANNPAYNVEKEATDIWCPESGDLKPLVKCFISIGTDNPGKKAVEDRFDRLVRKTLIPIATETEATALRFNSSWRAQYDRGQYFRFNVEQGLQNVGVVEHEKRGQIEAATAEYFGEQPQISRMRICINNLKNKHSVYIEDFS